ncbi:MAG: YjbH domain-containing protein [Alkalilacustris sp.]
MRQDRPNRRAGTWCLGALGAAWILATPGLAQAQGAVEPPPPALNTFGMPGLIDTPVATPMPDGTIALTGAALPGTSRTTLSFQIAPRLTGSFRYSGIDRALQNDRLYDRSFDISVLLMREGGGWPAITLGLRDFIGTGEYSSEFIVATRQITPRLRATAGIAWGRLATANSFSNPLGALDDRFRDRPGGFTGTGGRLELNRFFRGDAAPILGLEWQATDRLRLMAEFSGDGYVNETAPGGRFQRRTPINIGATWRTTPRTTLTGFVLHGDTVGLIASVALHPDRPVTPVQATAPAPVTPRPLPAPASGWSEDWAATPDARDGIARSLTARFAAEGLRLERIDLSPRRATVRYVNLRHEAQSRALGRAARILTAVLPPSVEDIVLLPTVRGVTTTAVTLRRSDLEALEHDPDGTAALRARAALTDAAATLGPQPLLEAHPDGLPRLGWNLNPYLSPTIMDPSSPVRLEAGLRLEGRYALASNALVSGALTQRVAGNLSGTTRALEACRNDGFCYERVRSDAPAYVSDSPVLERLTVEHFARPGANLYTRLSAGYLERMFAGVSAEVLWMPTSGPLALGAEINRVRRRAPSSFGGFLDYEVTTGHVSAYLDLGGGYQGRLDVGQYLAGDRGATIALSREFASGWQLGAYATLTDMPFSAFGEGSFDKGITVTIPLTWFDGRPSRARSSQTIRSLQRDGGARLEVANRLYPMVREFSRGALDDNWGTVWQ